jgi:hypothetical protein
LVSASKLPVSRQRLANRIAVDFSNNKLTAAAAPSLTTSITRTCKSFEYLIAASLAEAIESYSRADENPLNSQKVETRFSRDH